MWLVIAILATVAFGARAIALECKKMQCTVITQEHNGTCRYRYFPQIEEIRQRNKHLRHNLLSIYYSIKKGSQLTSKCNIHFDHKRVVVIYIKA